MIEKNDIRTSVPSIDASIVQQFQDTWTQQINRLKGLLPNAVEEVLLPVEAAVDIPVIRVRVESIIEVLRALIEDPTAPYDFLTDLTATDETPREPRFDLVYQLFSTRTRARIRVKAAVHENEEAPTAIPLWKGANWAEREVWDMFGIRFKGHPDLRRILMDERWEGHPLRKDYSIKGYQVFPTPEPVNEALLEEKDA